MGSEGSASRLSVAMASARYLKLPKVTLILVHMLHVHVCDSVYTWVLVRSTGTCDKYARITAIVYMYA